MAFTTAISLKQWPRLAFAAALVFATAACNELGWNPLDPGYKTESRMSEESAAIVARVQQTRLAYSLDVFDGGSSIYDEMADPETGFVERRRVWRGPPGYPASGGLVSIQATGQGRVTPVGDPSDAAVFWGFFEFKTLSFETLYRTENSLGPALWRRFTVGGNICVMFVQTLTGAGGAPRRNLAGYFCAPPGAEFSEGQAETVIQSVRVWDGAG